MLGGAPEVHAYFKYNSLLVPYWGDTICLAALSEVVRSNRALKLYVVFVSTLLLLSLCYAIGAHGPTYQRAQVTVILLPFAINGFLTLGFYGFLVSSSIGILILGLILRRGLITSVRFQIMIAMLLLVAYVFHPLPVMLSFLVPFVFVLSEVLNRPFKGWPDLFAFLKPRVWAVWPWLLPLGLILRFTSRFVPSNFRHSYSLGNSLGTRFVEMIRYDRLFIYVTPLPNSVIFIVLVAILGVWALLGEKNTTPPSRLRSTTLAILIMSVLLLFVVVPDEVGGGGFIGPRLVLEAIFYLGLLALASEHFDPRLRTLCSLLAAASVCTFAFEYSQVSHYLSPALRELRSATDGLPKNARVVMLGYRMTPEIPSCDDWPLLERTTPQDHLALWGAADEDLIVLNDNTDYSRTFPIQYRDRRFASSLTSTSSPPSDKQKAVWSQFLSQDEPDVDYVISWGSPSGVEGCTNPVDPPFQGGLATHFDRAVSQKGVSLVDVWRRRVYSSSVLPSSRQ